MTTDLLPILVSADLRADLSKTQVTGTLAGFVIQTAEQASLVADIQREAHAKIKELEAKRKTVTGPLDQAKKAVDALFKPVRTPFEKLKDHCNDLLIAWELLKRSREIEAREAAAKLSADGNVAAARLTLVCAKEAPVTDYGVSWEWRVKSWDVAQLEPGWRTIDERVAEDYCDRYKASEAIPPVAGVVFERVPKQRVKS